MLRLLLRPITAVNNVALKVCNVVGVFTIAAMVLAILVQVFFRYILQNALPWPDEFARFCMLWMTGMMAPIAYRQGGFVAIDMLSEVLGKRMSAVLSMVLLLLALLVLLMGIKLGYKHVNSGWLFSSSSLKIPLSLIGMQSIKLKLVYMYSSLWIGLILLTSVNVELLLRSLSIIISGEDPGETPTAAPADIAGAS